MSFFDLTGFAGRIRVALLGCLLLQGAAAYAIPTSHKKNQKQVPKDVRLPITVHKMSRAGDIKQRVVFKRIFRGQVGQTNVFHYQGWKVTIAPMGNQGPFVLQLDPRLEVSLSHRGDFVGRLKLKGRFVPYREAYLFEGQEAQVFTTAGKERFHVQAGFAAARPTTSITLKKGSKSP